MKLKENPSARGLYLWELSQKLALEGVEPSHWPEEVSSIVVEIGTALDNSAAEMTARFIIGDADIEADWDDCLAEFERIGLDRCIELMQEAFDSL